MSTNKVSGDAPNEIPLKELPARWEYACAEDGKGVSKDCRIDHAMHSLLDASKTADAFGPDAVAAAQGNRWRHGGVGDPVDVH